MKNKNTDKSVEFIKIQDDIYKFIRKTQYRMFDHGFRSPVECYAIFFVMLWHEAEAFTRFIAKEKEELKEQMLDHLKFKIQEVMDGKGPESIKFN